MRSIAAICVGFGLAVLSGCATPPRARLDDAQLMVRVKTALLNDVEIGLLRIDVQAKDGIVTLSGAAGTPAQRQKATEIAKTVEGVREVRWGSDTPESMIESPSNFPLFHPDSAPFDAELREQRRHLQQQ